MLFIRFKRRYALMTYLIIKCHSKERSQSPQPATKSALWEPRTKCSIPTTTPLMLSPLTESSKFTKLSISSTPTDKAQSTSRVHLALLRTQECYGLSRIRRKKQSCLRYDLRTRSRWQWANRFQRILGFDDPQSLSQGLKRISQQSLQALWRTRKGYRWNNSGYISQQDLRRVAKVLGSDAEEPEL